MKHEPKEDGAASQPLAQHVTLIDKDEAKLREHQAKKEARRVRGKASYVLKAPHYRDGELYAAGTVVTVEDEIPSKTWQRVHFDKSAVALVPPKDPEPKPEWEPDSEDLLPVTTANAYPNPGGVAPSTMNTASTSVTVATSADEAGKVADSRKPEEQAKDKGRASDKKY